MILEIGDEKRLLDFVSNIKKEKVALISHIDLDGLTAAKITSEIINFDIIKFIEYEELNESLVEELRKKGITKIVFTDIYIKDKKFMENLESFANVLIMDHHLSPDWNSEKTVFIKGEDGYSAGYLCYYLFSKMKNLEKWNWLVACSCISDYCHVKPKEWLTKTMEKYGDKLEYVGHYVRQTGKFWGLQFAISLALIYFKQNKEMKKAYDSIKEGFGDIGILNEYADQIKREIDRMVKEFEDKKEEIEEGYFFEDNPKFSINSMVSSILSGTDIHKMFVIIAPEEDFYRVSIRRQDGKIDCSAFLQNILKNLGGADGGGHAKAAGGHFAKKDMPEIRRRLGLPEKQKSL